MPQTTSSTVAPKVKGVHCIVGSKKPFPDWLRNHTVFKEMNKLDKVFPSIGLSNFKEEADIMNSAEAMTAAIRLSNKLVGVLQNVNYTLQTKLDAAIASNDKDRGEQCAKLQSLNNLVNNVVRVMANTREPAKVIDGKVVLRLSSDIFTHEKTPMFRKDEAVLRVMNKLKDMTAELKVDLPQVDQMTEFKDFSRVNVPNKKYVIAFSSTGEEGAWDISTISMRGVSSCQSWNSPQSRGLIGSVASKFVGVIYIQSNQDIPGYGKKMLNRCLVRFCISRITRKPALILDKMYPNYNKDTLNTFKTILKDKSGIDVLYTQDESGYPKLQDYYIPSEASSKHLNQGEFSYMDSAIGTAEHLPTIKKAPPLNLTALKTAFQNKVIQEIEQMTIMRRGVYEEAQKEHAKRRAEYDAAKAKWIEDNSNKPEDQRDKFEFIEPRIEAELQAFGGGGVMGLFKHCDKHYGANSLGRTFAKHILDSFDVPDEIGCSSKEEYHRKYLMAFLRNPAKVKAESWKRISGGSWMKAFPKSADKFFNLLFPLMKGYVIASCKELIKQSN